MQVERLAKTGDQWTFHRFPQVLEYLGLAPKRLIHVGAHLGQEVPDYRRAGIEHITLVEPDPDVCATLRQTYPDVTVIEAAVSSREGGGRLQRAVGAGVWSTLKESPLPHNRATTDIIDVSLVRLDAIQGDAEVAIIDTQGTELDALQSADLSRLSLVVVETQEASPTAHAGWWPDILSWMTSQGWAAAYQWQHERRSSQWFATYADSFFIPARSMP